MESKPFPFPPTRKSSLVDALRVQRARDEQELRSTGFKAGHGHSASVSSLPAAMLRRQDDMGGDEKQPRTLSQPQMQATPVHKTHRRTESAGTAARQHSLLAKSHIRPQIGFGHALTTEDTQQATREPSKRYALPRTSWTPHQAASTRTSFGGIRGLPEPSTCATVRTRKTSGGSTETATKSLRSAGSSFDIDIYGQMQLGGSVRPELLIEDTEMDHGLEEAMRRSLDEPLDTDGAMDLASPPPFERTARQVLNLPKRPQATRIPTLRFSNTPLVGISEFAKTSTGPDGLPDVETLRPGPLQSRKVSDYKYPRPAPPPPVPMKGAGNQLSSPARQSKRSRQSHSSRTMQADDDELLAQVNTITEDDASFVLEGEESFLAGFGQR